MAYIQAKYFGPLFSPPNPRQIVIHSVESELIEYLGQELAEGWFQNSTNETSAHTISDPAVNTDMVNEAYRAWHCGNGNNTSLGDEHTGRAAWTRAQWTTDLGMKMLRISAKRTAKQCRDHNIRPRWLSLSQLADNEDGLCTHNDMRLVRGGTTHTDPGAGFPYDLYLQMVNEELGNVPRDDDSGAESPNPVPTTPEDDDVTPQDKQDIIDGVIAALKDMDFTASDAYDAEQASRAGKTYKAPTLKFVRFLETQYNRASMPARDAFALRNYSEPDKGIGKTISSLFKLGSPITRNISLIVWAQNIMKTGIGSGDMMNRILRKVNGLAVPSPADSPSAPGDVDDDNA